jgi:hypothetical protein
MAWLVSCPMVVAKSLVELTTFKGLVENNLMDSFENASNYQNTASNALNGLHDDGKIVLLVCCLGSCC